MGFSLLRGVHLLLLYLVGTSATDGKGVLMAIRLIPGFLAFRYCIIPETLYKESTCTTLLTSSIRY